MRVVSEKRVKGIPGGTGFSFFPSSHSSQVAVNGRKARNQTLTKKNWPGTKFVPARPIFWECRKLFSPKGLRQTCSTDLGQNRWNGASWGALSICRKKEGGRWIRFGAIACELSKKRPKNSLSSLPPEQSRDKEFRHESSALRVTLDRPIHQSIPKDPI